MAKSLLLRALKEAFGKYVDGISDSNLEVAVWSGEVKLTNLTLKKELFETNALELPVNVRLGRIDQLDIKVPWSSLGSEPVQVTARNLFVLADVSNESSSSASSHTGIKQKMSRILAKRRRLKLSEVFIRDEAETGDSAEGSEGFVGRLLTKVVDNLQVVIENVHVRLEYASPGRDPVSIGLTLSNLSILTTDANGKVVFVERSSDAVKKMLHKVVHFSHLALYCDTGPFLSEHLPENAWPGALGSSVAKPGKPSKHAFILVPCSPTVRLAKNDNISTLSEVPRYTVSATMRDINLKFHRRQFESICVLHRAIAERTLHVSMFGELAAVRPVESIVSAPRKWWRYAYLWVRKRQMHARESSQPGSAKRYTWDGVVRKALCREKYLKLYVRSDALGVGEPLDANERRALQLLEDDMPIEDTIMFRKSAAARVIKRDRSNGTREAAGVTGWIASWWSNGEGEGNDDKLTSEEKEEILAAASYVDSSRTRDIPPGTVMTQILATLEMTVTIVDRRDSDIVAVRAEGSYDLRTLVSGAYELSAELSSLKLSVPAGKARQTVVEPLCSSKSLVLVDISLDPTSLEGSGENDHIRVTAEPFRIVLYPEWILRLADFFSLENLPSSFSFEAFKDWEMPSERI